MSEIKVGEYCRTSAGKIFKVSEVILDNIPKDENGTMIVTYITKHSPNIIDLIEVGDYVNGYKVKGFDEDDGDIMVEIPFENNSGYRLIEDIKSILTKEQYENNCYKVEE